MKRVISFGKFAYRGKRKINEITITLKLSDGKNPVFTATYNIYNSIGSDIVSGGCGLENLDTFLKENKLFLEIKRLANLYHLNDLTPGTPEQMACIEAHKDEINEDDGFYYKELNLLKKYGLDVVNYNGEEYKYGTKWLYKPIPLEDIELIKKIINGCDL